MASIRKIENKKGISYKIEVSNGYDRNGKKIRETTTFTPEAGMTEKQGRKAAEKFALAFEEKVKNGGCVSGDKLSLEDFVAEWLETYAPNQLEPTTLTGYKTCISQRILPALGSLKIGKIKTYHVEKFFLSLAQDGARMDGKEGGYSHNSIRTTRTALSSILTTAERLGIIENNPCLKAKLPKHEEEETVRCFTKDQTIRFLEFVDSDYERIKGKNHRQGGTVVSIQDYANEDVLKMQYKVFFRIALFGGLRRGELVGLTWKSIDFDKNVIRVTQAAYRMEEKNGIKAPKTKSSVRAVAFPQPVMDLLKEYKKAQDKYRKAIGDKWCGDDWVFIAENGENININSPYNKFRRLVVKYNKSVSDEEKLPMISLHDLRHTNASLLIRSNKVDVKAVSAKLGHADMNTTMRYYIHSYEEAETETAEILEEMLIENEAKVAK